MAAPPKLPQIVLDPRGISFEKWVNNLYLDLRVNTVPSHFPVERWWDWAKQFIFINSYDGIAPLALKSSYPNVEDWRKWAKQFLNSINAL